jgi:hypothetical protein
MSKNRLVTSISNSPGSSGALTISSASSGYQTFEASDDGLSLAGLTPTGNDETDIANGVVPRSLRAVDESVHWNDYGQISVGAIVRSKIQSLGYD